MIQGSLRATLDGIAETLAERVAPHVADDYARAQVLAAADLVAVLAPRVAWDRAHALGWVADFQALGRMALERSSGAATPAALRAALADPALAPLADADAVEVHVRLQRAGLVALQRHVAPGGRGADAALAVAVGALVSRCLDEELAELPVPPLDPRRRRH